MIANKGRDGAGIDKKRALAGALERETEFESLVINESAKAIYQSWRFRIADIGGIGHCNASITIQVAILDIAGHHITVLAGRVGDFGFVAEQSLGNVANRLTDFFAFHALPGWFVGSLLYFFKLHLIISKCSVQNHPKVIAELMLYFSREVNASRAGLTDIVHRCHLYTHIGRDDITFGEDVMTEFLINVSLYLQQSFEQLSLNT